MRRTHLFAWMVLVLCLSPLRIASAQDTPDPPTQDNSDTAAEPVDQPTQQPDAPAVSELAPAQVNQNQGTVVQKSESERLYHEAFQLLANGDRVGARSRLTEIQEKYPEDTLAPYVVSLLSALDMRQKPRDAERSSGLVRAEFVTFQTAFGIALGAELCIIAECGGQGVVASLIAGAGLGLGLSLWASSGGIQEGRVQAIDSGVLWGSWHAAAFTGMNVFDSSSTAAAGFIGLQLTGLGLGELSYRLFQPSGGDVSLATSGGIWTGVSTALLLAIFQFDGSVEAALATVLIASDIGLVGGALATKYAPMSRGRVLVIDSGGLLGGLVGIGIPILINDEEINGTVASTSALVGVLGGLTLATYFTRDWDADDSEEAMTFNLGFEPSKDGFLVKAGGQF